MLSNDTFYARILRQLSLRDSKFRCQRIVLGFDCWHILSPRNNGTDCVNFTHSELYNISRDFKYFHPKSTWPTLINFSILARVWEEEKCFVDPDLVREICCECQKEIATISIDRIAVSKHQAENRKTPPAKKRKIIYARLKNQDHHQHCSSSSPSHSSLSSNESENMKKKLMKCPLYSNRDCDRNFHIIMRSWILTIWWKKRNIRKPAPSSVLGELHWTLCLYFSQTFNEFKVHVILTPYRSYYFNFFVVAVLNGRHVPRSPILLAKR